MALVSRRATLTDFATGLFLTLLGVLFILLVHTLVTSFLQVGSWENAINILAIALFAFSLTPLRQYLTVFIKTKILRGEITDQEYLRELSTRLLASNDLVSVISTSMEVICKRINSPFAVCYILHHDEEGSLVVKQVVPWQYPSGELPSLDQKRTILDYVARTNHTIQATALAAELIKEEQLLQHNRVSKDSEKHQQFISNHATKSALLDTLQSLHAGLVIPLLAKDQLFGLMFMSPHQENREYTNDELSFIDIATSETITSIQRANYFEGDLQKTEFISIASHELRTPLTAVRGYLSMILDEHLTGTELNQESTNQLAKVYSMTRELITMVNDLLTLSRLESGKTKIVPQQVNLLEIIQRQLDKRKADAANHQVSLSLENHRAVPDAWADPEGFAVVIDNFLTNAIYYNKPGGKVSIKVHSHVPDGVLAIEVRDTGIGMNKEQMSHLFEKFYRVATTETEGITGTGLGLNISQTYIRAMNGSIAVQSKPNKGTAVTVYLPLFTPDKISQQPVNPDAVSSGLISHPEMPIGLMLLSPKRSEEEYGPADLDLLEAIGNQAIITIQRAKLYEGDQMKTQFVSIASHELLTPISAIEGYLSLVTESNKTKMAPKTAEFLGNVTSAIHRLSTLVKDLLSVSRLESGRITITQQDFDITTSIKETLAQLEFVAQEHGITLKVDKPPKDLPMAHADPERTTQVLMNLVGNAIKYNRAHGSVTVAVSTLAHEGALKISVTDTGIGMNKEQMSHLFEKFYRVASQETVGIIGTGLGLYITKSIVERMCGRISVKSTIGKGSTFSFTIPATRKKADHAGVIENTNCKPAPSPVPLTQTSI